MGEFLAALDPVNRIADHSPGFVWRLRSDASHGATTVRDSTYSMIVNVSVWESYDTLHAFVYRSPHGACLRRRSRWFFSTPHPSTALWWVQADARPTVDEALQQLRYLQVYGPSPRAFTPRRRFEPDGKPVHRWGR